MRGLQCLSPWKAESQKKGHQGHLGLQAKPRRMDRGPATPGVHVQLAPSSLSFQSRYKWRLSCGGCLGVVFTFQQARPWLGLLDVNQKSFASEASFESGPAGFSHPYLPDPINN